MSLPDVGPSTYTIERFWKRVAEACDRCKNSKIKRKCEIDVDHPSCRPCRANKVGCDRKPRFVFEMTKDQFFPTYAQFLKVFQDRKATQLKRLRRQEYRFRPGHLNEERDMCDDTITTGNAAQKTINSSEINARIEELETATDVILDNLRVLRAQFEDQTRQLRQLEYQINVRREVLQGIGSARQMLHQMILDNYTGTHVRGEAEMQTFGQVLYILDETTRRLGGPSYDTNNIAGFN
ncbi:hypothetical protein B0H13DRAFT_2500710 [Mycena leptocephala]|nr:hypothetical protein B0H13DRAFT_2500710 [Mycena leptocephala]